MCNKQRTSLFMSETGRANGEKKENTKNPMEIIMKLYKAFFGKNFFRNQKSPPAKNAGIIVAKITRARLSWISSNVPGCKGIKTPTCTNLMSENTNTFANPARIAERIVT